MMLVHQNLVDSINSSRLLQHVLPLTKATISRNMLSLNKLKPRTCSNNSIPSYRWANQFHVRVMLYTAADLTARQPAASRSSLLTPSESSPLIKYVTRSWITKLLTGQPPFKCRREHELVLQTVSGVNAAPSDEQDRCR
jgi:hypothetical protein